VMNAEVSTTPSVRGLPFVGNALEMMRDPAAFFVDCYRKHGPVFKVKLMNERYTVLAGVEAANFMNSREGKDCLRSKEFWQGLVQEYGATKVLPGEDGESHKELRDVMRRGFAKEAIKGRYNDLVQITDRVIERDWTPGRLIPVVEAMQYMVVDQLGTILTGQAPLEYVKDIRRTILYILNVLVTRQRPKILLRDPRYVRAKARVNELGAKMIAAYYRTRGQKKEEDKNLIDDIMEAHLSRPDVIPESDLVLTLTGPYVAGLDTVANTTASMIYAVLKHPHVLARIHEEVDTLFAGGGPIEEADLVKRIPSLHGAILETLRMYPIAVAQLRTANKDFTFCGHSIREGQMLFMGTSVPHFMEEYFPSPRTFDIDRYKKGREEHLKSGVFNPFGRGPHTCLGKGLAEVQIALTMARLFHRLDLELVPKSYVLKTKSAPTPGPAMDFKVRVVGRREHR
jgi:cytochrome P450